MQSGKEKSVEYVNNIYANAKLLKRFLSFYCNSVFLISLSIIQLKNNVKSISKSPNKLQEADTLRRSVIAKTALTLLLWN